MEPTVYSIRRRLLVLLGVAISVATLVQAGISYRVALREVDAISDYHMIQEAYSVRRRVSEPAMPSAKRSPVEGEDISFKLQITPLPVPAPHAGIGDNRQGIGQDVTPVARGFSTRQIDGKPFRVFTVHSRTMLIEVMHDMSVR
ncbi:MAG: hypothetical protein P4L87_18000, partial [Formivibrio sp.]|nr:hypothetical protein [Formivibrio sp.]